jgi:HD superfamily phosphohydrolase
VADIVEPFEIRDPVHGFVRLSRLEWEIINQPVFQRLRRIRQLAWTDMVYPGAVHTRFEHSLGVMQVCSRLFDTLRRRSGDILRDVYNYDDGSLERQRRVLRLAALMHDLGHAPFSHAAEELLPMKPDGSERYVHEDYSAAAMLHGLKDTIETHPEARLNGIHVADILAIFDSRATKPGDLVWKDLVSGQMDADRMDYLLRDAWHAGVQYGRYDLDRVVSTVRLCPEPEGGGHQIGIDEDGVHAVEGLLIARFMMFTQLYFHKTRAIYDHHLAECLRHLLAPAGGTFPPPTDIAAFLAWDDWRVLGLISDGKGGEHGEILRNRRHYRLVHSTSEQPTVQESELADTLHGELQGLRCVARDSTKSWYKPGPGEIAVWRTSDGNPRSVALSALSSVVTGLAEIRQRRLYVPERHRPAAQATIAGVQGR